MAMGASTGEGRVLLLMPRELYILSRFAAVCTKHGLGLSVLLEQPAERRWQLVSYSNGQYVNVETLEGGSPDGMPPVPPGDFAGVVPTSEFSAQVAEHLAHRLDLFHNPLESVAAYRNKYEMRRLFAGQGAAQPEVLARFVSLKEVDEFDWSGIRFPVIVKPVDLTSSLHVRLCADRQEARQALRRIFLHVQSFAGVAFSGQGVLETYAPEPEFSAECVIREGRLEKLFVTTKFVSPLPACDEIGHMAGAPVSPRHQAAVQKLAGQVARAWKTTNAVLHVEYKYDGERAIVIEAACRIGGDRIAEVVELQHGVSLEEELIALRCPGLKLTSRPGPDVAPGWYHGVRFLFDPQLVPSDGVEILQRVVHERAAEGRHGFALSERVGHELVRSRSLGALTAHVGRDCEPNAHLSQPGAS
jgi:hypothetical protein